MRANVSNRLRLISSIQILIVLLLSSGVHTIVPPREPHEPRGNGKKLLTFKDAVSPGLAGLSDFTLADFNWVRWTTDGWYTIMSNGSFVLANVVTGQQKVLVAANKIPQDTFSSRINANLTKILWGQNETRMYRGRNTGDYLIQDVASGAIEPLTNEQNSDVQYAAWSPSGDTIAFALKNNLYIWRDGAITQITHDGGSDLIHGALDWVYWEEIFDEKEYAFWFSPDGEYLLFLSFNDTGVLTSKVNYFMDQQGFLLPYPRELDIRIPKPGTRNPTARASVLKLGARYCVQEIPLNTFSPEDQIIGEVAWLTAGHSHVVLRVYNRVQDRAKLILYEVETGLSKIIQERDGTDGWLEPQSDISYVGRVSGAQNRTANHTTYYIDTSDESGFKHIYLFPVSGGRGIQLTSGAWDVRRIVNVDTTQGLVYYLGRERHTTESHLYSVSYQNLKKTALVDDTTVGHYSASFTSGGQYYVLSYEGPNIPYQELFSTNSTTPIRTIKDNAEFNSLIQQYDLPDCTYMDLSHPSGDKLPARLCLPVNFDPSKKYPVLFTPYGAPALPTVKKVFRGYSWESYIASDPELQFITYTVDNRGAAALGRKSRGVVKGQLGTTEARDQIWAARELAKNPWVDRTKIGIWGRSYGGYLSGKVVEADSGVFSFAIITSPAADLRAYDSMYIERYLNLPNTNEAGYNKSAIRNVAGFKNIAGSVLLQHGSGDDNTHIQHTAALLDLIVRGGVSPEKFEVMIFTDSDHDISEGGADTWMFKQNSKKLFQEKNRVNGSSGGHQWSRIAANWSVSS